MLKASTVYPQGSEKLGIVGQNEYPQKTKVLKHFQMTVTISGGVKKHQILTSNFLENKHLYFRMCFFGDTILSLVTVNSRDDNFMLLICPSKYFSVCNYICSQSKFIFAQKQLESSYQ